MSGLWDFFYKRVFHGDSNFFRLAMHLCEFFPGRRAHCHACIPIFWGRELSHCFICWLLLNNTSLFLQVSQVVIVCDLGHYQFVIDHGQRLIDFFLVLVLYVIFINRCFGQIEKVFSEEPFGLPRDEKVKRLDDVALATHIFFIDIGHGGTVTFGQIKTKHGEFSSTIVPDV